MVAMVAGMSAVAAAAARVETKWGGFAPFSASLPASLSWRSRQPVEPRRPFLLSLLIRRNVAQSPFA